MSLILGLQAALWPPLLSHQATFCMARPGPWVLGKKHPVLVPELWLEMKRGALAKPAGWSGDIPKPTIPML